MTENELKNEKPTAKKVRRRRPTITAVEQTFSGPIPPPAMLRAYEDACPGAADRILKLAEKQAEHRQTMESEVVQASLADERKGINYSFILSVALMLVGALLLINDKQTAGLFAVFGPSVFQAGSYLYFKMKLPEKDSEKKP